MECPSTYTSFLDTGPTQSLSDLIQDVKGDSSKWINLNKLTRGRFSWQEGYGAFFYEKKRVPGIIQYVLDQEIHHKKRSFMEEYLELLREFEVDYDSRYLFTEI